MPAQFVVDNSIVMAWCFEDEANVYADAILDRMVSAVAIVPALWALEVANVLLVAERQGRLSEAKSARFLALLRKLPIVVDRAWPERLMSDWLALGRNQGLSSYDAAYLELAMRQGLPLATTDKALAAAAGKVNVPLFKP